MSQACLWYAASQDMSCLYMQVMHIAAVSEITNLLLPSLKTLHVSSFPHSHTHVISLLVHLLLLQDLCGIS